MNIRSFVARTIPLVPRTRRYVIAARDSFASTKPSYSQHGEDRYVYQQLFGLDLRKGIYIDVGANQPTQISNTYLFYRMGLSGVVIEPNQAMEHLFNRFRPRDRFLRIGCGEVAAIAPFKHASSSVLSSFANTTKDMLKIEYVPVLPLDVALRGIGEQPIYLLSIDTEGFDLQVLQGAQATLARTICAIVEQGQKNNEIDQLLHQVGFERTATLGCNAVYICNANRHRLLSAGN